MITHQMKSLLNVLADGKFHTGSELGQHLNMTRAGVWKMISQLKLQVVIEAQRHFGYRIPGGLNLLSLEKIHSYFTSPISAEIHTLHLFDSIPSTNTWLSEFLMSHSENNLAIHWCFAESQTQGRGRLGRSWFSPFGYNLYVSTASFFEDISLIKGLSLVVAIGILRALKALGIKDNIGVKWPNDIYCQGFKLGGILIEISGEVHDKTQVIIGIGINCNMPKDIAPTITKPWTSLQYLNSNQCIDRNQLAAFLIENLTSILRQFKTQGFSVFVKEFRAHDVTLNQMVELKFANGQTLHGISQSIDDEGYFCLKTASENVLRFASGEISLNIEPIKNV